MPDSTTIARPYAKAVFEYALSINKLADWSSILNCLALSVADDNAKRFIENPVITAEQQSELLLSVSHKVYKGKMPAAENLVRLLADNKRLLLLPDMYIKYEALRSQHEKTLAVDVVSFAPLSPKQEKTLIEQLTKRLQRQVTLDVSIDETILGGAIIQAGDLVIDGSVRGKLKELGSALAE